MKMGRLEKIYVNSKKRAEKNTEILEQLFTQVDLSNVRTVLEVGCGIGVVASNLSDKYQWDVTGIDLDPKQIEIAKNDNVENENLKFFEADVTELPFEDGEFDGVLSFDVLHHIPDWDKALHEISRVLKPKGLYLLNDLALAKIFRIFENSGGFFTADDIIDHLRENSFKVTYAESPKVNIFAKLARHFCIISQKN